MGLKPERQIWAETTAFRLNEVKSRGYFLMLDASNEGYAKVIDTASSTLNVLGCLENDVVADTSTSGPRNFQKAFEVWKGGKVPILEAGRIQTNITHSSGVAISVNDKAYVNTSGVLVNYSHSEGGDNVEIGVFEDTVDSDGYITVRFDCRK